MGTGGVDKKNDKSILYSLVKRKVLEKVFLCSLVFTKCFR